MHPDLERKFGPVLVRSADAFDIELQGGAARLDGKPVTASDKSAAHHTLNVDVTGKYFFGVGLADVTIAQNKISGSVDPSRVDSRYDDDVISDGRLAFYGKAKFKGKYLVTAQADTNERDRATVRWLHRRRSQEIFRRLDPKGIPGVRRRLHHLSEVDTMGRFYLRVAGTRPGVWGNFYTGCNAGVRAVRALAGGAGSTGARARPTMGRQGTEVRASVRSADRRATRIIGTGGSCTT